MSADEAPDDPNSTRRTFTLQASGEEATNYDFVSPRTNKDHTTGFISSAAHLVKSCLGGGIVSIHCTYRNAGFWLAVILNGMLGFMVVHMMVVLAKSAQKIYGRARVNTLSYPEIAEACFQISKNPKIRTWSRVFRYMVDVTIMIDLFGSCCCYQVLIGEQISQLISHYLKKDISMRLIILAMYIPCVALCMILTLKYLSPFSIVADVVIIIVALCTIVYGTQAATADKRSPADMPFWSGHVDKVFMFMGGCVFSMEGVGVVMPIENNMAKPKKVGLVLYAGMSITVSLVYIIGIFGYWGFYEKVSPPITTNFPMSPVNLILKIALPLMIYVTFALNFWIPFNLVWVYLKKGWPRNVDIKTKERIWRVFFVTVITIVSVAFPQVVALMSVIGAFCLSNMGFLYPATIEFLLKYEDPGVKALDYVKYLFFVVFALTLMTCGTIFGFMEIISTFAKSFK